jgi:Repeat of unknown function (DUF5907)
MPIGYFTKIVAPSEVTDALNSLVNSVNGAIASAISGGGPPTGAAGGVLSGTYPNPGMAAGAAAANLGAFSGDLTGTPPAATIAALAVTSGKMAVGAAAANLGAFSGDLTGTPPAATIASGVVTSGKMAAGAAAANLGAFSGDLTGTPPAATIAALAVTNAKIANSTIDLTTKVTGVLPVANGGTGISTATPYDIASFFPGVPGASALVTRFVATRSIILPVNLTGSKGSAGTASTGTATIDIQQNGSSKGSVVFTSSATATFTFASPVTLVAGDILTLVCPGSPDGSLANISITLAGTR